MRRGQRPDRQTPLPRSNLEDPKLRNWWVELYLDLGGLNLSAWMARNRVPSNTDAAGWVAAITRGSPNRFPALTLAADRIPRPLPRLHRVDRNSPFIFRAEHAGARP